MHYCIWEYICFQETSVTLNWWHHSVLSNILYLCADLQSNYNKSSVLSTCHTWAHTYTHTHTHTHTHAQGLFQKLSWGWQFFLHPSTLRTNHLAPAITPQDIIYRIYPPRRTCCNCTKYILLSADAPPSPGQILFHTHHPYDKLQGSVPHPEVNKSVAAHPLLWIISGTPLKFTLGHT